MSAVRAVDAVREGADAPLGAVVGVSTAGHAQIAVDGHRDLAGSPVTIDTTFDLASVSKVAATTSAIHRLAQLEHLRIDDRVSRYLPASPCAQETTIRDLLTHRAGLWEWQPLYFTDDPALTVDALPLRYAPGAERHYSDLGFMLLGRIIEAVTNTRLDTAVRDLVHAPLQMTATGYGPVTGDVASSSVGDRAEQRMVSTGEPYPILFDEPPAFAWRDTEVSGSVNDGNCFHAFQGISGHAGLFSTASDLLALGTSLASRDLSDFWGTEVSTDVFRDGPDTGQALGWRSMTVAIDGRPNRMLWHGGYTGCALGFVPGEELAVVLLTNRLFAEHVPPIADLWAKTLAPIDDLDVLSTPER